LFCIQNIWAQNMPMYNRFFNEGKRMYADSLFYEAINQFSLGIDFSGQSQRLKDSCYKWIDLCGFQLQQLKQRADSLLRVAQIEKQNAQQALARAEEMQRRVETAMFDKAVKQRFPEWKGYANERGNRTEILNKIDSLDLSQNALLRVPQEVAECKNLKHLNLLGNPDIDWKQSAETFAKLGSQVEMYVSVYDLSAIDSVYWHFVTGIELLQTKDKPFDNIPANILQQKQLKYLDLSGNLYRIYIVSNNFSDITSVCNLTQLEYLNFEYCNVSNLPLEIGKLTNLISLNLENNELTTLPAEIGKLLNLTRLNLYSNQLTTLPAEIGKLPNLISLDLNDNQLTTLPAEIGNLKNLTRLNLYSNQLTTLPAEIGNLQNLTSLGLGGNQLTTLPAEIGKLQNLASLDLGGNQLTILPTEIGKLQNLASLDIGSNQLTTLPDEIGKLQNLASLDLGGNQLTTLPAEIGNLQNLKGLILSSNKLTTLPAEIGNLQNLTSLNLYYNQLTTLPVEIGNLQNLTNLSIVGNNLTTLPSEIGNLQNLTSLDLIGNDLTTLPSKIGNLQNLTSLSLSGNQFTTLPAEIGKLQNLTSLELTNNQLTILPAEIGKLISLTNLNLSENKLTTLPAEIGKLSNLTTLNLGIGWSENKNQLTYLPLEIGNLTNLTSLDLSGNEGLDIASLCNAFANFPKEFMINSSNSNDSVLKIILPQFSILPPEMGKLTNLTILDLRGNDNLNITSVFEAFANYPRKISLLNREKWGNVDKNTLFIILPKIVFLPSEIGKLTNLTELDLRESDSLNIASVWDAFVNFPRNISIATQQSTNTSDVNALKIMLPGLTSFPVEITKLNNLIELTIRNRDTIMLVDVNTGELIPQIICDENPIILPSEIKNLTNLTTLNLSGNVTNLPAEIGNLQNLTRLDLFDNKLTVLPSEIGKLQNLTGLYLSDNQLTSLPVEIGKLQNLTILDVSNNHLTTLPAEIGTLQNLTEFYYRNRKAAKLNKFGFKFQSINIFTCRNGKINQSKKIESNCQSDKRI